ncbi:CLUMA_CG013075, isoform A [Clunio marinus]|uniref:CLUMA_CG013075, isoform A n=1 Tax=Clunio marinus TaxID=568069 RepID=A0A1J1IMP0_9DIPT|nr:CLUMA_CG013075, isoform A [Clunio marinus]
MNQIVLLLHRHLSSTNGNVYKSGKLARNNVMKEKHSIDDVRRTSDLCAGLFEGERCLNY